MSEFNIRVGDLVLTDESYYALVCRVLPDGQVLLRLSNGLEVEEPIRGLTRLFLKLGQSEGAKANFAEVLRPEEVGGSQA